MRYGVNVFRTIAALVIGAVVGYAFGIGEPHKAIGAMFGGALVLLSAAMWDVDHG